MTGKYLQSAWVAVREATNRPYVQFVLINDGAKILADYTNKNIGRYLAIMMDKRVMSSTLIKGAITDGTGIIEGNFTLDQARQLVEQLRFGPLPFPLKVVEVTPIK